MADFLLLDGPNLNLLGTRAPEVFPVKRVRQAVRDCVDCSRLDPGALDYELALQAAAQHVADAEEA